MQRLLHMIYPPQCVCCGAVVEGDGALCGPCWRETPFLSGLVCDGCGAPLPGSAEADALLHCDSCLRDPPPWSRGRAAMLYRNNGRRMVLALKHGARIDTVPAAARWLARAARPILCPDMLIAPVPLHRLRLLRRRFNQSALLAQAVARETGLEVCPDLLLRTRATPTLEGHGRAARAKILNGAIRPHPGRLSRLAGRAVLLVDDVMTSGATLRAATDAARAGGAKDVCVLALARVVRDA